MLLALCCIAAADQYQEAAEIDAGLRRVSAHIAECRNETEAYVAQVNGLRALIEQTDVVANWTRLKRTADARAAAPSGAYIEALRARVSKNEVKADLLLIKSRFEKRRAPFASLVRAALDRAPDEGLRPDEGGAWKIRGREALLVFRARSRSRVTNFSVDRFSSARANATVSLEFLLSGGERYSAGEFTIDGSAQGDQFFILNSTAVCSIVRARVTSCDPDAEYVYVPKFRFFDDITVSDE